MTNFTFHIPDNAVVVGLCAGRHDMPVVEFMGNWCKPIYGSTIKEE